METLGSYFFEEIRRQLRGYKRMAEGAIAQVTDEQLLVTLDPESNSIAILVQHIAGNMRSRPCAPAPCPQDSHFGASLRASFD